MKITCDMIRKHNPCYDPSKYADCEKDSKSLLEILQMYEVPAKDRVWVVTRFLDDKTNRLFAVWCAREALKLVDKPDPRSIAACDVAERFANGDATKEELNAAYAADAAAYAAAYAAADAAAYAAAYAAYAAADAAYDAAADAADAAAAYVAADAAADAAYDAAREAQVTQLIKMLPPEYKKQAKGE